MNTSQQFAKMHIFQGRYSNRNRLPVRRNQKSIFWAIMAVSVVLPSCLGQGRPPHLHQSGQILLDMRPKAAAPHTYINKITPGIAVGLNS